MKILDDNTIVDIIKAPYHLVWNTIDTVKYDGNLKSVYRCILISNVLSLIFGFIKGSSLPTIYYHIGSLLFIVYIIYITNSKKHIEPYKDTYNKAKNKIKDLKEKSKEENEDENII